MRTTEDLYELIQSLSKTEKGYFKKYSGLHVRGQANNYILLFNAIEKQKESRSSRDPSHGGYDEKALVKKFKNQAFTRNFAVAKNFLYNKVLHAMNQYHHSIHSEVRELLHRAEFLVEKGLNKQSLKAVMQAKEIAKQNDMHWALLEIYKQWENALMIRQSDLQWRQKLMQEETDLLADVENEKIYRDLYSRLGIHYATHGITRDKGALQKLESIIQNKNLKDISLAKTFKSKLLFYDLYTGYFIQAADFVKAYQYAKEIIHLFSRHPEKIKSDTLSYIEGLNDAITTCLASKRYEDMPAYLEKLEGLELLAKSQPQTIKIKLFDSRSYNKLNYYTTCGIFREAIPEVTRISKEIPLYLNFLSNFEKLVLFSHLAIFYFGTKDYQQSIFWLNRIRNEVSLSHNLQIESFHRLFYLIVHYEAGHDEIIPSLVQSLYRFLRKKERLYKFEILVIDFLRKLSPANDAEKLNEAFKKLHTRIQPLLKDLYEKNAFHYFDYMSWLESKTGNKSFAEIVREKSGV